MRLWLSDSLSLCDGYLFWLDRPIGLPLRNDEATSEPSFMDIYSFGNYCLVLKGGVITLVVIPDLSKLFRWAKPAFMVGIGSSREAKEGWMPACSLRWPRFWTGESCISKLISWFNSALSISTPLRSSFSRSLATLSGTFLSSSSATKLSILPSIFSLVIVAANLWNWLINNSTRLSHF